LPYQFGSLSPGVTVFPPPPSAVLLSPLSIYHHHHTDIKSAGPWSFGFTVTTPYHCHCPSLVVPSNPLTNKYLPLLFAKAHLQIQKRDGRGLVLLRFASRRLAFCCLTKHLSLRSHRLIAPVPAFWLIDSVEASFALINYSFLTSPTIHSISKHSVAHPTLVVSLLLIHPSRSSSVQTFLFGLVPGLALVPSIWLLSRHHLTSVV
jgi:hypothetical protein